MQVKEDFYCCAGGAIGGHSGISCTCNLLIHVKKTDPHSKFNIHNYLSPFIRPNNKQPQ